MRDVTSRGKSALERGGLVGMGEKRFGVDVGNRKPATLIFAPKWVEQGRVDFEYARKNLRVFEMILPVIHEVRAQVEFIEQRILVLF